MTTAKKTTSKASLEMVGDLAAPKPKKTLAKPRTTAAGTASKTSTKKPAKTKQKTAELPLDSAAVQPSAAPKTAPKTATRRRVSPASQPVVVERDLWEESAAPQSTLAFISPQQSAAKSAQKPAPRPAILPAIKPAPRAPRVAAAPVDNLDDGAVDNHPIRARTRAASSSFAGLSGLELAASGAPSVVAEPQDLWTSCVQLLAKQIPEGQLNAWIRPLQASVAPDGSRLTLYVANRVKQDWIRAQYAGRIAQALQACSGGRAVELELATRAPVAVSSARVRAAAAATQPRPKTAFSVLGHLEEMVAQNAKTTQNATQDLFATSPKSAEFSPKVVQVLPKSIKPQNAEPAPAPSSAQLQTHIQEGLTFATLVEGTANRMARAAALQVADEPGADYNPLFIYGGVGLGKTHIMYAIGNRLLAQRPAARVLYIHAEQFLSDVMRASQQKAYEDLYKRYHYLDLLLVDDVQSISGKKHTEEEFLKVFEAILARRGQIVISGDRPPQELSEMNARLTSRFSLGLNVAIAPPELEMRVEILKGKAMVVHNRHLPEEVAFFIAQNLPTNVRELEGALRKVIAYAHFNQRPVSIELAREALRDLLNIQSRQITVENIQKIVADFAEIDVAELLGKKRTARLVRPRQIAMFLAKELTKKSLPEIAELFGGRDHTTVLHAVRKIAKERPVDAKLDQDLYILEQSIRG